MKSRMSLKLGYVESKIRSLGQMLEKPCVRSIGHIFCLTIMKLFENFGLDTISNKFENRSFWVKNYVTKSNLRKPYVCSRGHIFSPIIMKLGQLVCLDKIPHEFENGSCQVKN